MIKFNKSSSVIPDLDYIFLYQDDEWTSIPIGYKPFELYMYAHSKTNKQGILVQP